MPGVWSILQKIFGHATSEAHLAQAFRGNALQAYMNISVRVLSANAQAQIKALQAQVGKLQGQLAAANATAAAPGGIASPRYRKSLIALGSQAQWTGRQLQYNLTLPLAVAGFAATKFALDNEKAFVRVKKVYGDLDDATAYFRKNQDKIPEGMDAVGAAAAAEANELEALKGAFEALSTRYGIVQKEVLETAGAWAAAGSSGVALAKSTELSIKAAILGDLELGKATESLIAIQAQYSLSTKELGLTLSQLNAIENQTGIQMRGLIDGFARTAGVAREAGVTVRELGAMMAALVPATGSASTAGNGLKTIISRLLSPTGEAAKLMREFGVDTSTSMWNSSTAMERLMVLAGKMNNDLQKTGQATSDLADDGYKLSDSQKQIVATTLGSRWQLNRFLVLMRELGPEVSYYEKALNATADNQKVFALATKELNEVLKSNPQRLKIIWATIQNGLATAIQPMIPYIVYLAQQVANLVTAFTNLDPSTQKLILVFLVLLALIGPLVKYMASFAVLIGTLLVPIKLLTKAWIGFATVTKTVNGVTKTTRRSLVGMIASLVAAPFKKIGAGFGALIGWIWGLGKWFKNLVVIQRVWALASVASSAIFAAGFAAASTAAVATWRAAWIAMVAIHSIGVLALVRRWLVGLTLMSSMTSVIMGTLPAVMARAFAGIAATMSGVFVAVATLFSRQMFIPLVMAMGQLSVVLGARWTVMWTGMLWTFRVLFLSGWAALHVTMTAIATAAHGILLRAYVAFSMALGAVMTSASAMMTRVWAAMHVAMRAISMAFWASTIRLWIAGAMMLPRILLMSKRALLAAWAVLIGLMRTGALLAALAAAGPWVAAGAAIIGVLFLFRRQLVQIWDNIVTYFADSSNEMTKMVLRAWNALPQGVANALTAVARIVQQAALQIYEWFSYINPFARHSPSLVDNVTLGMQIVSDQFKNAASSIGGHVRGAYADIKAFGSAVRNLLGGADSFRQAQQRAKIKKFAPGALDEYDQLAARLKVLQGVLATIQQRMNKQQAVVDRWTQAVERANDALDKQQGKLDRLTAKQQKWQDKLAGAEEKLNRFAQTPIKGMGAMSDAIFENQMAQNRLRLEMMKMEEVTGPLDDIRSKIEAINGAQEMLRGEQAALRSAGAGSEILSHYDDQIAALEATKRQQSDTAKSIEDLSDALGDLQRQGERLDLEQSLKFDPLTRQIEKAAYALDEMPFDKIMKGVRGASVDIEKYQEKLDTATAAVNKQQGVVDRLTQARDKLKERLEAESDALAKIKDQYDRVADAISSVEQTMSDASSAADTMAAKMEEAAKKGKKAGEGVLTPAVQNFRDAEGGNFAKVGGSGIPIRTNWEDQSAQIEKFTQDLANEAASAFDKVNPFSSIKRKWGDFKSWWNGVWGQVTAATSDMVSKAFGGVDSRVNFQSVADKFKIAWAKTKDWFKKWVIDPLIAAWDLLAPSLKEIWNNLKSGFKEVWKQVGPALGELGIEIGKMGPAFKGLWNILKPVIAVLGGAFVAALKIVLNVVAKSIYPLLQGIGNIIENIIQIVKGAVQIISGFFMMFSGGDGVKKGFEKMAAGVMNIFSGLFGAIGWLIYGAIKTIAMAAWGVVDAVIDIFMWLWDKMVGHSIIPDLIKAVIWWFQKLISIVKWLWNNVVMPIIRVFKAMFSAVIAAVKLWWTGITLAWTILKTLGQWVWNNVLQPIIGFFVSLWQDYIQPALVAWWSGMKDAWKKLKGAGEWIWDNVLVPIWDFIKKIWNKYIAPFFKEWWRRLKNAWDNLKDASKWIWDKVLVPVWNKIKDIWTKYIQPFFKDWWRRLKNAWDNLKGAGKWIWDNMLSPVWGKVKDLWTNVKTNFGNWWTRIRTIWKDLKGLGAWFKTNVMDPVFQKVKDVWTKIKDWLTNNKDLLMKPMKAIVNGMIGAVNKIIGGLNKVAKVLPGVEWEISPIEKLAAGGPMQRRANRGFKTNGARAIVGEGKANYPEFVIPTDPTYRKRARGLLAMAASKLGNGQAHGGLKNAPVGEHGVPEFGIGGWLGNRWDDAKGLGKEIAKLPRRAVGKTMDPLLDFARDKISGIGWKPVESPPLYAINKLEKWVKGTDKSVKEGIKKHKVPTGGNVSVPDPANPGGRMTWKGGTFSNKFVAHMQKAEQIAGAGISVMQGGFRPATSYSGTSHRGDAVDLQVNAALIRALRRVGIAAGDRTGLGNWAPHTHAVPGPGAGYAAGSAVWQWQDYMARGGMNQPLNSAWGLKEGGIALARHGGTVLAGDGRYDEAVVPLPKGWRTDLIGPSQGDRVININGDLSFPNIKNGEDAKTFIDNIENLAKD